MKKGLFLFIVLIFMPITVLAEDVEVIKQVGYATAEIGINLTSTFDSLANQYVINIPYQAVNNISYLSGFQFRCGRSYVEPDGAWVFRFYSYDTVGTYNLLDSVSIDPSACQDWYHVINISFTSNINTSTFYSINRSIAVGIYSTNTVGTLYYFGSYLNHSYSLPGIDQYENITDIDGNFVIFPDGSKVNYTINSTNHIFYGNGTTEDAQDIPVPDTEGNTSLDQNISGYYPYNSSGDGKYNVLPNNTGFDNILKSEGLCTSGTCKISDGITYIDANILYLWWLGFGAVLFQFYSLGRQE